MYAKCTPGAPDHCGLCGEINMPIDLFTELKAKKFCLPVVDIKTGRYKSFQETYGTPESWVEVLPKTTAKKEQKLPWRFQQNKARCIVACAACLKPRVVYSDKRILKADMTIFKNGLEATEYMCGQDLFQKEFAIVDPGAQGYDKQSLFFDRFKTSHKITCASPIQKNYYTLKEAKTICYQCISELNDRPDILEKIVKAKELYSVVLPSCLSVACGKFKTANPKRPKRPAPGARPKPAAKRRRGGKG